MKNESQPESSMILCQTEDGRTRIQCRFENETVWLTQAPMAELFQFKCKDPDKMKEWYRTHLGLDTDKYGTNFEWRQGADSTKNGFTQWSPFTETTTYFEPSKKDFMIIYRVEDLEALVEELKKEGVNITDSIEIIEYGKFVHILDIEGNKIEL